MGHHELIERYRQALATYEGELRGSDAERQWDLYREVCRLRLELAREVDRLMTRPLLGL